MSNEDGPSGCKEAANEGGQEGMQTRAGESESLFSYRRHFYPEGASEDVSRANPLPKMRWHPDIFMPATRDTGHIVIQFTSGRDSPIVATLVQHRLSCCCRAQ